MTRIFARRPVKGSPVSMRGIAEGLAAMALAWESLSVVDGMVEWVAGRPRIIFGGASASIPRSFGLTRSGDHDEVATISEGRIIPHGLGIFSVAAASVTLTGGPMVWVYLSAPIGAYTPGAIAVASGADATYEPITTNDTFRVTLYEFEYLAATTSYRLTNVRAGGQDIQLMAVARG